MTPVKTITSSLQQLLYHARNAGIAGVIPIFVYSILDICDAKDTMHALYRTIAVVAVYCVTYQAAVKWMKRKTLQLILDANKQRDEENREFAELVSEGKLYPDSKILDIIKEMGAIMNEEQSED